jgi:hypothetical protein
MQFILFWVITQKKINYIYFMLSHNEVSQPCQILQFNNTGIRNMQSQNTTTLSHTWRLYQKAQLVLQEAAVWCTKGKGKVHPITGHESPEGSTGISLLFAISALD